MPVDSAPGRYVLHHTRVGGDDLENGAGWKPFDLVLGPYHRQGAQ